jgi:hypothetical protein
MKSYGFIVPVALGMGLALFGPLVWRLRKELVFGWRQQYGNGDGSNDADDMVKRRAEILESMEPLRGRTIVLLTAVIILMCGVFGVLVAYGGGILYVLGLVVIVALIVFFNRILFAQVPPLPGAGD